MINSYKGRVFVQNQRGYPKKTNKLQAAIFLVSAAQANLRKGKSKQSLYYRNNKINTNVGSMTQDVNDGGLE